MAPRKGAEKRPLSPEDQIDAKALDGAVEWMIDKVLSGMDHTRPLGTLNKGDLRRLAVASVTGFILEKHKWDAEFRESGRLTSAGFAEPI